LIQAIIIIGKLNKVQASISCPNQICRVCIGLSV
jgi:hypothetical protein